jgi:hypothetical protein
MVYSVVKEKKMPLTQKQRKDLEVFLAKQAQVRMKTARASMEYLKAFPANRNVNAPQGVVRGKEDVFAGPLVRSKPKFVWYTRHALLRGEPDSLSKNNINATIDRGEYLDNRNSYYNNKYQQWSTNRGAIAPKNARVACPKRRISTGNKTVVLAFCYPRGFMSSKWAPDVVTAYRLPPVRPQT